MSKSRGNIVRAEPIRQVMGIEALRYFLFREVVFGQDGSFSYDALVGRYNSELANGLGNLASRTLTMIQQYRDGMIPAAIGVGKPIMRRRSREAIDMATPRLSTRSNSRRGLEAIWTLLSRGRQVHRRAGAVEAGQAPARRRSRQLDDALYASAETLRIAVALLHPILPESTAKIWAQLGMTEPIEKLDIAKLCLGPAAAGPSHRR